MTSIRGLFALLLLGLLGWGLALADAATIYIDKSASTCATYRPVQRDCTGGTAQNYNDFQGNMTAIMPAGTIVEVRSGTYTAAVHNMPACTPSQPCIVRSYQNEDVLYRPSSTSGDAQGRCFTFFRSGTVGSAYITLSGAGTDGGKHFTLDCDNATSAGLTFYSLTHHITASNLIVRDTPLNSCVDWWSGSTTHITFANSDVSNCGDTPTFDHGIYVRGSDNVISGNTVTNVAAGCLHLWENTGSSHRNVIERNFFTGCPAYGILMGSGNGNIARYNVITDYSTFGIRIGDNSPEDNLIYNNTIYNGPGQGAAVVACIENKASSTRAVIKNNICQGGGDTGIDNLASTGTVSNNTTNGSASFKDAPDDFSLSTNIAGTSSIISSISGTTLTAAVSLSCNGTCSQGAHNSPLFSSCSVEDGDATTIRVLFTTLSTMRGSAAANWAAVVAGSGVAESAVQVVGTTRVDITVPAIANGQTVTIAYTAPASSPLSDSLSIGGTRHSAVRSFTAQSCTNNVGAAPSTTLVQVHSGWFEWYGDEANGTSLAARGCGEDQPCTFGADSRVLVRLKLACTGGNCDPTTITVRYSLDGGAYTEIPNVLDADGIHYAPCPVIPHLTDTTERLTAGSALFVEGKVLGEQASLPNVDLAEDDTSEFGYCVGFTGATATDTYDFRLYTQAGDPIDTYTVTPRATIGYGGMVVMAP